jgi:hypothetical protein
MNQLPDSQKILAIHLHVAPTVSAKQQAIISLFVLALKITSDHLQTVNQNALLIPNVVR